MVDARERRMAENERMARLINEVIEYERPTGFDLICECSQATCTERLDIGATTYAEVRSHPRRFIVREGHENLEIESVVERLRDCLVVEKHGDAGRVAEIDATG